MACQTARKDFHKLEHFSLRLRTLLLLVLLPPLGNIRAQGPETSAEPSRRAGFQVAANAAPAGCSVFGVTGTGSVAEACNRIAQAFSAGDLERARHYANLFRTQHSTQGAGFYWLGQIDFKEFKYISALRNFEASVDLSPAVAAAHVALALCYASIYQYRLFEKEMLRVLDQTPADPLPYYHLGRYYFLQLDQPERGANYLQKALDRNPEDYRSSYYLGYYHEVNGNRDTAKTLYTKASTAVRAQKTQFGAPFEGMSRLMLLEDRLPEAIRFAQEALSTEPDSASARLRLGKLWVQSGNFERGIKELQKAIELDPTEAAPYYQLSRAYLKVGKQSEAQSAQSRFLKVRSVYSGE